MEETPASIDFCHRVGLDYVSMSPPRIPGARLAAAQAAIRNGDIPLPRGLTMAEVRLTPGGRPRGRCCPIRRLR